MQKRTRTLIKLTSILMPMLLLALSMAWGVNYYSGSVVVDYGSNQDKVINLVQGSDKIQVKITGGSLDAYMDEQGIDEVNITADLEENWVDLGLGLGYYTLKFEFGPSGAYFEPDELRLEIKGEYISLLPDIEIYDETGEAVASTAAGQSDKMTFYIPHFSCYYYEDYCY